jgi:hypothetical protein
VYEAYDPSLKRAVALKVARPEQVQTPQRVERFLREAQSAGKLMHPHVVAVFDSGKDGAHHYIASAFVPGRPLDRVLREHDRGLDVRAAALIVRKLAEALAYAHREGVVHRDVKPGNVMLREDGEPMLMDFGLAARQEAGEEKLTQGQVPMGTPAFMAPEQWKGQASAASDQYSLGVTLFELLTGQLPFAGGSPAHLMVLHETQPPPSPRQFRPGVPRDLEAVCLKCLEKEPAKRYADCGALADDLRRWAAGETVTARLPNPAEKLIKWARRNPWPAGAAALALALVLGLAVYAQTRPAYLEVHVKPRDATVLLDGQPVILEEGRALVAWRPGRSLLQVSAPDHEPHEQSVVLVRGQANTVVAEVDLTSRFGFCRINSEPEFAQVEIVDDAGRVIGRGATPFASDRLPSGEYLARIQKDGYQPREVKVVVPLGERQETSPVLELTPLAMLTEGMALLTFVQQTMEKEVTFPGFDDPKVTLREALEFLAKRHKVTLVVDERSFRKEMVDDVLATRIVDPRPIPPATTSFRAVLQAILARLPVVPGAVVIPRKEGAGHVLVVVTGKAAAETPYTILHPVGDLTTGPNSQTPEQLLAGVVTHLRTLSGRDSVRQGSALRYVAAGRVFYVSLPWASQERVASYLDELRKAVRDAARQR